MKKKIIVLFTSFLLMIPVFTVPVNAEETYYTYDVLTGYIGSVNTGSFNANAFSGLNVNLPTCDAIIIAREVGNYTIYSCIYFVYVVSDTEQNAINDFNSLYSTTIKGVQYYGDTDHISSYDPAVDFTYSTFTINTSSGTKYVRCASLLFNTTPNYLAAYGRAGVPLVTGLNGQIFTYYTEYLKAYITLEVTGAYTQGFSFASWAGGWVSASEEYIPMVDLNDINFNGTVNGTEPEGGEGEGGEGEGGEGGEGGSGSGSSSLSQYQQQQIAEGAVQVNNNSSIESDAVQVTVNNSDIITEETIQRLDQTLQNNNPYQTSFQNAITTIDGFRQIGIKFAQTSESFLSFLPDWVLTLLSAMFVLLFFFIILRLLKVFHG